MRSSVAVVRGWQVARSSGSDEAMNAAALVNQVVDHVALALVDDLDEAVHASSFVIGCPSTGDGVVVITDDANGRSYYRRVVEEELGGDHPSLRVERNSTWLALFA